MADLTYREMWETYVEPNLRAQAEYGHAPAGREEPEVPPTVDDKVAECQAAGFLFGADPLEVGKAARKSWPVRPEDVTALREKMKRRAT